MTNNKNKQKSNQISPNKRGKVGTMMTKLKIGRGITLKGDGTYSAIPTTNNHYSLMGNAFSGNRVGSVMGPGQIIGSGTYKLKGPNTVWDTGSSVPIMHNDQSKVRFCHREYVGQISSSAAFTIQYNEQINPTNQLLFPYLSGIAGNFQEYKFKGLCFYFKSTSADALNSTNTALGAVMMSAQYRSDAPAPSSKVQMLNEMWSVDGRPSANLGMPVEVSPVESPLNILYCGDGSSGTNDPKFFNLAKLFVATQGSQATADIGELHVCYDIELYKPILSLSAGPYEANCARYSSVLVTTANQVGTPVIYRNVGLPITVSLVGGATRILLDSPALGATYSIQLIGTAATAASFAFTAIGGGTFVTTFSNNTGVAGTSAASASPFTGVFTCFVTADSTPGSDFALDITGTYVGLSFLDIFVTQVTGSILGA